MKEKKVISLLLLASLLLILTACGSNSTLDQSEQGINPKMDQLSADGKFHYTNPQLGVSLVLPAGFDHYQTQVTKRDDYSDLEIFVPTADRETEQKIPGYARPVMIRVFTEKYWDDNKDDYPVYVELARKNEKVYTVVYWKSAPSDWKEKWSADIMREIQANISIK